MKVGIFTIYKTGNYGGTLQAYATKTIIQQLEHEAELIPYCADSIQGKINRAFFRTRGLFGTLVTVIEKLYYSPRNRKTMKWVSTFASLNLIGKESLKTLNDQFDLFWQGAIKSGTPIYSITISATCWIL